MCGLAAGRDRGLGCPRCLLKSNVSGISGGGCGDTRVISKRAVILLGEGSGAAGIFLFAPTQLYPAAQGFKFRVRCCSTLGLGF